MPFGNDQYITLTYTPTWIFTPVTGQPGSVRIYNQGTNVVYVGGVSVTQNTGIPLPPGPRPLVFNNVLAPLYAVPFKPKGMCASNRTGNCQFNRCDNCLHPATRLL